MFVWFFCCYFSARLLRNFTFNQRKKKAREKFWKRSDIIQFGRWCKSFSSAYALYSDEATRWLNYLVIQINKKYNYVQKYQ